MWGCWQKSNVTLNLVIFLALGVVQHGRWGSMACGGEHGGGAA